MQMYKSNLSLTKLQDVAKTLVFTPEAGYVEMVVPQSNNTLLKIPEILEAVKEIETIRGLHTAYVMLNAQPPYTEIPEHRDFLEKTLLQPFRHPKLERWFLAIETNLGVLYATEEYTMHFGLGYWHGPIEYWKKHSACNRGSTRHVHLIVDLDVELK